MKKLSIQSCAAVLALLLLTHGCALLYRDLEEPRVRLVNIMPHQIGVDGIQVLCRLRVDNPNDVSIPIKGGQIDLEVEGLQIAHGALMDGFTVEANGSELVDVIVDVDAGRSLILALRIFSGSERELDYALTGHVDVAISMLGRVQFNESGSVPLIREPDADDIISL